MQGGHGGSAWSYLAGVTVGQDISDREEQRRPPVSQFTIAKSYDTFGPIGPYLVTADELDDPTRCRSSASSAAS